MIGMEWLRRFAIAAVVALRTVDRHQLSMEDFERQFARSLKRLTERAELRALMYQAARR